MWPPPRNLRASLLCAALAASLAVAHAAPPAAAPVASPVAAPVAAPAAAPAATGSTAPSAAAGSSEAFKDKVTALPTAEDLRPHGPVEITADRTDAVEGTTAIYSGHVNMDSDTLKLDGDRLELRQFADHQYTAKVTGAPAHMSHAGGGPENPAMAAHAKELDYDSRSGIVDLIGEAFVDRAGDTTTADTIHYNLLDRSLQAVGGKQQVHIVIQPPPDAPAASGNAGGAAAPSVSPATVPVPVPATVPKPTPASTPTSPATAAPEKSAPTLGNAPAATPDSKAAPGSTPGTAVTPEDAAPVAPSSPASPSAPEKE